MAGMTGGAGPRTLRTASWIRHTTAMILGRSGAGAEAADAMADAIVEAHLRGVETHGVRRLRPYVGRIRSSGVDGNAHPLITRHGGILHVDGRNGIGHYVATAAADAVAVAAQQHGVAVALVRNSNHFGFAGHYATMIASKQQVGIVTSNGQVCVGPEGAKRAVLSNNPLAIAAPVDEADAFVELDLATSMTSRANVVALAKTGGVLPPGIAQDREGAPTQDAARALEGSLLAFGGMRGFGLLLAIELITGILSGGAYADLVSSKEAAPDAPERTAHTMIAIDIDKAIGVQSFRERIGDFIARVAGVPVNPQAAPVRYPGQRRWNLRRERMRDGIPLTSGDVRELEELARELRVSLTPIV